MTDQKNPSPLRTLICRLLSGTYCGATGEELAAVRAENDALRAELQNATLNGPAPAPAAPTAMDCETEIDTLFSEFVRECPPPPHGERFDDPNPIGRLSRSLSFLADAHAGLELLQFDRKLVWGDPEAGKRYLGLISGKAKEISKTADHMALVLDPEKYRAMIKEVFADRDTTTSAPEQDHGDNWEFLQAAAQGVAAERAAFEAIADAPETASSEDDFWASLPPVEDDEPITDAEIADTLGALFAAAGEIRAERLAAEAEADVAPEAEGGTDAQAEDDAAEPVTATEPDQPAERGEVQPDVTGGWQSRTVYGVEVLGTSQDKAWAGWLTGHELSGPELARHLREEGYEGRIATETASRMLQHSRAKAAVGRKKNAKHYHLLSKAG